MTRRNILQSLVACVAASAMEVCGWSDTFAAPAIRKFKKAIINPEYVNARCEERVIMHPDYAHLMEFAPPSVRMNYPGGPPIQPYVLVDSDIDLP